MSWRSFSALCGIEQTTALVYILNEERVAQGAGADEVNLAPEQPFQLFVQAEVIIERQPGGFTSSRNWGQSTMSITP